MGSITMAGQEFVFIMDKLTEIAENTAKQAQAQLGTNEHLKTLNGSVAKNATATAKNADSIDAIEKRHVAKDAEKKTYSKLTQLVLRSIPWVIAAASAAFAFAKDFLLGLF